MCARPLGAARGWPARPGARGHRALPPRPCRKLALPARRNRPATRDRDARGARATEQRPAW
eukprot:9092782-Alexandrium_andersonii.AAC.1